MPSMLAFDAAVARGFRALAFDRDSWITVHPNSEGPGTPVLIGRNGEIKAGLGGKFTGQKISEVHGDPGRANSRSSAHAAFNTPPKPTWKASIPAPTFSYAPSGPAYSVSVHHAAEKVAVAPEAKAAHEAGKTAAKGVVSEIAPYSAKESDKPPSEGKPAGVFMFDANALKTDAKRFQYKEQGDTEGVTTALKGVTKWDASKANQVIAWEDTDGEVYVVDGHQRTALARRLIQAGAEKEISIPGILYRAKDGIDADDIRCIAAAKNIAEGSGSPIDGAKILRTRPDLMDGSMPISRTEARQSFELAALNDDAFRLVTNEVIPYQQAAVVGRYIPKDADRQNAAMKALSRFEPKNETEAQVLVQRVAQAELDKKAESSQGSMFGDLDEPESTAGEEMRIVAKAIGELKKDKSLFGRVVANAERLEETGSSIERNAAKSVKADSELFIRRLASEAYSKGPVRDKLVKAAKDFKDGRGDITDAVDAVLNALRQKGAANVSAGPSDSGGSGERDADAGGRSGGLFGGDSAGGRTLRSGWRAFAFDRRVARGFRLAADEWQESKHPRGQPNNAGEFGPGGGGSKAPASASAAAPAKPADEHHGIDEGHKIKWQGKEGVVDGLMPKGTLSVEFGKWDHNYHVPASEVEDLGAIPGEKERMAERRSPKTAKVPDSVAKLDASYHEIEGAGRVNIVEQVNALRANLVGDKLTPAETDATKRYTFDGDFMRTNDAMRQKGAPPEKMKGDVEAIESAIDKVQLDRDYVLWRGLTPKAKLQLKAGDEFQDKAFVSTTADYAKAREFAEDNDADETGYIMKLYAPKGTHALIIDGASKFPGEAEVLLQAGSRFRVLHINENTKHIYAELVTDAGQAHDAAIARGLRKIALDGGRINAAA